MQPGETIGGRFRIERMAGAGGMGTVYLAADLERRENIALKLLDSASQESLQRFEREAVLLRQFTHRGIVRYVTNGRDPDAGPYLVMEWVEGETLADRLGRKALTLRETVRLGRAVAD